MSERVCEFDGYGNSRPTGEMIVRCRDCREVRHELPARVGSYERAERWMCGRWKGCETLPDAFCSFGKRAAK